MIDLIYVVTGLLMLFIGGEALVRGSAALASLLRISKFIISAIIIGFGTSTPELSVSIGAALKASPDIALGNVIGSNIANVLLIMGCAGLISPIVINNQQMRRDVFTMIIASMALLITMALDQLRFTAGLIYLGLLAFYLTLSITQGQPDDDDDETIKNIKPIAAMMMLLLGALGLIGGASLLVDGAVSMAQYLGLSEAVIGLTIVAMGSSLPELATGLVAAIRKQSDILLGNIIGSSIFNILAILGMTAIIAPIPIAPHMLAVDIWVMLAAAGMISVMVLKQMTLGKRWAGVILACYGAYILSFAIT